ncbi:bacillithiol biosynthesis deacetylase BshB2 [Alicyclobacillus sp. SO9]|uniref:bacillithiol biosynthesis deacetylase BshB2 n=1 Tax=Alicyclobacillus sp. SO9 TaxID=2665646 RepID=UPI0018E87F8B|nr:bacillithiol biosynthesis deacetylase BshB2 [Alicyclobacillus sp. SO9]QQE77802.1 bacillithiol biosynthesis deacetylase BshB2 [Alicyclobacillus sp. SO9]
MERHVLVVLPHPDDESFGAGGTIALHRQAGTPVTYLCGTLGQMGRNMGKPFFATRERLPDIRKSELEAACAVLDIQDLRFMGLRDKTVEFEDPEILANRILAVINEVNPTLIITQYPGFAVHPDHNAMGHATVLAVAKLPKESRPPVHCMAMARNRFDALGRPDVVVDITQTSKTKLNAIRAHRSQSEGLLQQFESGQDMAAKRRVEQFLQQEMFWLYPFED